MNNDLRDIILELAIQQGCDIDGDLVNYNGELYFVQPDKKIVKSLLSERKNTSETRV